jgi:hypothetical protein
MSVCIYFARDDILIEIKLDNNNVTFNPFLFLAGSLSNWVFFECVAEVRVVRDKQNS